MSAADPTPGEISSYLRGCEVGNKSALEKAAAIADRYNKDAAAEIRRYIHAAEAPAAAIDQRDAELRIHALGAAISRRDWHAAEKAHAAIRDAFHNARRP